MDAASLGGDIRPLLTEILAYLNLSSGAADPRFRGNLVSVSARWEELQPGTAAWPGLPCLLRRELDGLRSTSAAFTETTQVEAALRLAWEALPAAYRRHHGDLLAHYTDDDLFRPLFLARAAEAVLHQGPPWNEEQRIVEGALGELNDYIGYRPVAVLHNGRRMEPYEQERVCPLPLYFRGVGVAAGRYRPLLRQALDVLAATNHELCEAAGFDLELLDELALDPRSYDFDHPANKRPNHLFGMWDPHTIDGRGRYRRFVLHSVTLEAILARVDAPGELPPEEALWEAGVLLAGVILMASGTSGWGPGAHDSSVTLANLLPSIVRYRDAYYQQWLTQVSAARAERLREEAARLRQPFGAARQHLNRQLAKLRATQMQHVCLAQLFARMGYPEASLRQAEVVPVASARMLCRIDCRLAQGHHALDRGELEQAAACLPDIEDLLQRAVQCGALVDPWNVLGFGGQFSLFPALENTVRDHRVDVLVRLMERIFGLQARVWKEAASTGQDRLAELIDASCAALARWWDQFGATTIEDIDGISGHEAWLSASEVAKALRAWFAAGEAAGDIGFWRQHVESLPSSQAYALVVETLLERRDHVAASALLVQWVSLADAIELDDDDNSFHELAARWLCGVLDGPPAAEGAGTAPSSIERWQRVRRFFDYLEANAEEWWSVPRFPGDAPEMEDVPELPSGDEDLDDDDPSAGLFNAAYEDVVYRDSASDGQEGETIEGGGLPQSDYEMDFEAERLEGRLAFLATVARLWRMAAAADTEEGPAAEARRAALEVWFHQARRNEEGLLRLLQEIHSHRIPDPTGSHDSLVEYDRRRAVKEALLDRVGATCVVTRDSARVMRARLTAEGACPLPGWRAQHAVLIRAAMAGDAAEVRRLFPEWLATLRGQPLLYLPIGKRGEPAKIIEARSLLRAVRDLLRALPRLGLLAEAIGLLDAAQESERLHPVGPGGVTEFDRLFQDGLQALVETLVEVSAGWRAADDTPAAAEAVDAHLVDCLQSLTEALLQRWLAHSNNLRLSSLEHVADEQRFAAVASFVQAYGRDLFTPRFLNLGNLRAILHQGVDAFLTKLAEDPEPDYGGKLLAAIGPDIPREEAATRLRIVVEAVVENFAEYRDYNATTTQSDHGEMLHVLLDFLRLKASYERVAWNLRPIALTHEVLVRQGRVEAAALWRQSLVERTSEVADQHLHAVTLLERKHGMRLATVADRLAERFVRPLEIDRLKALVAPAIEESRRGLPPAAFVTLEEEADAVAAQPCGAGLDMPAWIIDLQEEVTVAAAAGRQDGSSLDWTRRVPRRAMSLEEVQRQCSPQAPA